MATLETHFIREAGFNLPADYFHADDFLLDCGRELCSFNKIDLVCRLLSGPRKGQRLIVRVHPDGLDLVGELQCHCAEFLEGFIEANQRIEIEYKRWQVTKFMAYDINGMRRLRFCATAVPSLWSCIRNNVASWGEHNGHD
jgi:hypothetical protein